MIPPEIKEAIAAAEQELGDVVRDAMGDEDLVVEVDRTPLLEKPIAFTAEESTGGPVAFGATCAWWDSKTKVSTRDAFSFPRRFGDLGMGLPCCPVCGGVLFEVETEAQWWEGARRHELDTPRPGYVAMLRWSRGRCFPSFDALRDAYEAELVYEARFAARPVEGDDPELAHLDQHDYAVAKCEQWRRYALALEVRFGIEP